MRRSHPSQRRTEMNIDRKVVEQAFVFVSWFASDDHSMRPEHKAHEIAESLRKALEQPAQQEPTFTFGEVERTMQALRKGTLAQQQAYEAMKDKPLYTAPQVREPLTDEEILALSYDENGFCIVCEDNEAVLIFARAIEAKLKEKNT
jgi:hypothetical protein